MCARRNAALVRAAAEYLESIHAPRGPFVAAVIDVEGAEHRLPCQVWPEGGEGAKPPKRAGGREFSPLEEKIVDGLRGSGWMTTADLAAAIGEELSNDFRVIVRNLADRGYVTTNQRHGVRLAAPEVET